MSLIELVVSLQPQNTFWRCFWTLQNEADIWCENAPEKCHAQLNFVGHRGVKRDTLNTTPFFAKIFFSDNCRFSICPSVVPGNRDFSIYNADRAKQRFFSLLRTSNSHFKQWQLFQRYNWIKKNRHVVVTNNEVGDQKSYLIPFGSRITVKEGQEIMAVKVVRGINESEKLMM